MAGILDGGFDVLGPADTQDTFIVDMNVVVVAQIVVEPSVALIWAFLVDLFDFVGQTLILLSPAAQLP